MEDEAPKTEVATITPAVDIKEQVSIGPPFQQQKLDDPKRPYSASDVPMERDIAKPTTDCETLVHVLKGNLGTGLLAMPEAFKNAGLWVGLSGIPIMGLICIHCMHTLLKCSRILSLRSGSTALSYEETAEAAFRLGPPGVRRYARPVLITITSFLVVTQVGFCCVYFVFISQNLWQAVECMTSGDTGLSPFDYMAIIIVPLLLICYIPHLKYLAPVSILASLVQTVAMIIIFYFLVRDLPQVEQEVPAWAGWSSLPLYFGSAIYAFEGIGLVLPLENKMKTPMSFGGLRGVLNTAMMIVVCLYASVGFFGYLQYGASVEGSITLNLPAGEPLAQSVKILMALAVYMTYPLQLYVPLEILSPSITKRFNSPTKKRIAEYAFRTGLVLLTFVLAAAIPNIGLFISLVGAVSSSALAIIFPPIVELVTVWPDTGKGHWILVKGVVIVAFGLLGFVTGTATSIQAIITFFVNGQKPPAFQC